MSWWVVALVVYGVVALAVLRPVAGHFAWSEFERKKRVYDYSYRGQTEPDDWFEANCIAFCVGVVWPLALLVWLGGRKGPVIGAERRAVMEAQRRRIAELERELGVE